MILNRDQAIKHRAFHTKDHFSIEGNLLARSEYQGSARKKNIFLLVALVLVVPVVVVAVTKEKIVEYGDPESSFSHFSQIKI